MYVCAVCMYACTVCVHDMYVTYLGRDGQVRVYYPKENPTQWQIQRCFYLVIGSG